MKSKKIILGLFSLILICSCQKANDPLDTIVYKNGAKLERVLLYTSIDSEDPGSIVTEYEYDDKDRISRISSPMYQDGEIVGTIHYDLYEYNSQGKLIKIENFHANSKAPTGFLNLRNYIYTYSIDGKKEKETIEYPQISSSEYSLFKYEADKLTRIEKYDDSDKLKNFIVNDYNFPGELVKETTFTKDSLAISRTQHIYKKGLHVQSDVFSGEDMENHAREIFRTYDENSNLIILESNELLPYSSMMSYVLRYEYFEE